MGGLSARSYCKKCAPGTQRVPSPNSIALASVLEPCGDWGWSVVLALGIGAALYVGGGAGFVYQTQGVVGLPHKERWGQLAGLVVDGSSFALGGFKKADGFEKIPDSLADSLAASPPQVGGGGHGSQS